MWSMHCSGWNIFSCNDFSPKPISSVSFGNDIDTNIAEILHIFVESTLHCLQFQMDSFHIWHKWTWLLKNGVHLYDVIWGTALTVKKWREWYMFATASSLLHVSKFTRSKIPQRSSHCYKMLQFCLTPKVSNWVKVTHVQLSYLVGHKEYCCDINSIWKVFLFFVLSDQSEILRQESGMRGPITSSSYQIISVWIYCISLFDLVNISYQILVTACYLAGAKPSPECFCCLLDISEIMSSSNIILLITILAAHRVLTSWLLLW